MKPERDEASGETTTGHEWNGIKELNTPVPRAFRIWLWLSIAVAALIWLFYPSWPLVTDNTRGLLDYSSRKDVMEQVVEGQAQRSEFFAPFETQDIATLAADPTLQELYEPSIKVLYADNVRRATGRT